jgi:hypothetical protein
VGYRKIEEWTCDRCGAALEGDNREKPPRAIPGCPAFKPEPYLFAVAIGFNQTIPFQLCDPCVSDLWNALDPRGTMRQELNARINEAKRRARA